MIYRQPPEWALHDWVWIGFPSHADLWLDDLDAAREETIAFARAVDADGRGERVVLVAADKLAGRDALAMAGPNVDVEVARFGDVWLRDTGPIILTGPEGSGAPAQARDFGFNGWGGKYELPGDDTIGHRLAQAARFATRRCEWVLEGGAIDVDGTGLAVTTEQCLLNPNRNAFLSRNDMEARLAEDLGIDRVLWLGNGLLNDHTDGHVDNLARFVAPGVLAVPEPTADDPNEAVYRDAAARGRAFGLEVVGLPSPGKVEREGEIVPASYMNFYIGNATVVVPAYGAPNDAAAVAAVAALFPGRTTVGLRADHILTGGGSFHCMSQQVPPHDTDRA
ncbi:agmatine deiminase family protein [Sphingomonas solaris]|uniref:Agmatine deiminase family protein n=1 Tax=Alterirhizorhabdus solaris TaxID=2529389 RepID=A0A558R8R2_9SPHN|nr:agmatine deiminase family protein [Sphingomonas solaris]TVV75767.1 agmatine deiminase family protein [Sphingomonas solaris]